MGYGTRALQLLFNFYMKSEKVTSLKLNNDDNTNEKKTTKETIVDITEEEIKPKKKLKPLLEKLEDVKPPFIYWIGALFGLNSDLYNFWNKNGMFPIYLKLTENDITGEHSCIMLKPLQNEEINYKKTTFEVNSKLLKND